MNQQAVIIEFPSILKQQIKQLAVQKNYPQICEIIARGSNEQLILNSQTEAQAIADVARSEMLQAHLKYPYWQDDHPSYDKNHEREFFEVSMGLFEKTIFYVGQEFKLVTDPRR